MEHRRAIFAVKPHLAEALVRGDKQIEFRRSRPRLEEGDVIYVYATSPVQAIVGRFTCGGVIEGRPTQLWRDYRHASQVTRSFFLGYFNGNDRGFAIPVKDPERLDPPLALDQIQQLIPGFYPPRSYRFLADGVALANLFQGDRRIGTD